MQYGMMPAAQAAPMPSVLHHAGGGVSLMYVQGPSGGPVGVMPPPEYAAAAAYATHHHHLIDPATGAQVGQAAQRMVGVGVPPLGGPQQAASVRIAQLQLLQQQQQQLMQQQMELQMQQLIFQNAAPAGGQYAAQAQGMPGIPTAVPYGMHCGGGGMVGGGSSTVGAAHLLGGGGVAGAGAAGAGGQPLPPQGGMGDIHQQQALMQMQLRMLQQQHQHLLAAAGGGGPTPASAGFPTAPPSAPRRMGEPFTPPNRISKAIPLSQVGLGAPGLGTMEQGWGSGGSGGSEGLSGSISGASVGTDDAEDIGGGGGFAMLHRHAALKQRQQHQQPAGPQQSRQQHAHQPLWSGSAGRLESLGSMMAPSGLGGRAGGGGSPLFGSTVVAAGDLRGLSGSYMPRDAGGSASNGGHQQHMLSHQQLITGLRTFSESTQYADTDEAMGGLAADRWTHHQQQRSGGGDTGLQPRPNGSGTTGSSSAACSSGGSGGSISMLQAPPFAVSWCDFLSCPSVLCCRSAHAVREQQSDPEFCRTRTGMTTASTDIGRMNRYSTKMWL